MFAGAYAAPAPRESAGRFTPLLEKGKDCLEEGAASPQDDQEKECCSIFHETHDLARRQGVRT